MTKNPPLCIATNLGDTEVVKWLLDAQCDVNANGSNSTTTLHQAIAHRYTSCSIILCGMQNSIKYQNRENQIDFWKKLIDFWKKFILHDVRSISYIKLIEIKIYTFVKVF